MPYPGFLYWGVFIACGAVLVAYLLWMLWTERTQRRVGPSDGMSDES